MDDLQALYPMFYLFGALFGIVLLGVLASAASSITKTDKAVAHIALMMEARLNMPEDQRLNPRPPPK